MAQISPPIYTGTVHVKITIKNGITDADLAPGAYEVENSYINARGDHFINIAMVGKHANRTYTI
ncbi:hypothetical protein [Mucilaginibacter flavidus]|uniref:hypothetical protein n=1 Tax=Mucilaginibacter flavidus TaxID=2949309 RepID=UPI002093F9F9|nr:hypothetical protein [Mucilaginibacter flavidus]